MKYLIDRIFAEIRTLQHETKASDIDVTKAVSALIRRTPISLRLEPEQTDAIYRLTWLAFIRESAICGIGFITTIMQIELIENGSMSLSEWETDIVDSNRYAPAWISVAGNTFLESSANAGVEVSRFSGPDLRILVEIPISDFHNALVGVESLERNVPTWLNATNVAQRVMIGGDPLYDFLRPTTQDEFVFRMNQFYELEHANDQLEMVTLLETEAHSIPPVTIAIYLARGFAQIGDIEMSISTLESVGTSDLDESAQIAVAHVAFHLKHHAPESALKILSRFASTYKTKLLTFELAHLQSMTGALEDALTNILLAIEADEFDPLCRELLGYIFFQLGQDEDALSAYSAALQLMPTRNTALTNRGELLVKRGDFQAALVDFDAAIRDSPTARAYGNRANALYELKEFDAAMIDVRASLSQSPDDPLALTVRAKMLEAMGLPAAAAGAYVTILQTSPEHDSFVDTALIELARLEYGGPIVHPWPMCDGNRVAMTEIGPEILHSVISYTDEISRLLADGLDKDALALGYELMERFDPERKSSYLISILAEVLVTTGNFESGREEALQAIAHSPDATTSYHILANALLGLGQFDQAALAMAKACEIDPNSAVLLRQYAALLEDVERFQEAIVANDAALKILPGHEDTIYNKARLLAIEGDNEGSRRAFNQLLKINPTDSVAFVNLGSLEFMEGNIDVATTALERALEIQPDYVLALQKLILYRTDRRKAVVDFAIELAVARTEYPPEVLEHMTATRKELVATNQKLPVSYLRQRTKGLAAGVAMRGFLELELELAGEIEYWALGIELAKNMTAENRQIYFDRFSERLIELDPTPK